MTMTRPSVIRSSDLLSSMLLAGGSGDSITAQEKSLGKEPRGASRTRMMPSRNAVMRSLADPAVSSTPSLSFSTRCTFPMCCQPSPAAALMPSAQNRRMLAAHLARRDMVSLSLRRPREYFRSTGCTPAEKLAGQTRLCREPLFKKIGSFSAFNTPAYCVHHAALCCSVLSVKGQPVRNVDFGGCAGDIHLQRAHLEKALLEEHA